ncbi:MAG TPA: choice-of-anchor tandem repeat GloVer-containing protein [Candidatus Sulfotelmatobacter sp.]|nr:choice-of-anchor tandem repeat GloVer-containing protein [Candidatus Sulfotelmatobacter sp.]
MRNSKSQLNFVFALLCAAVTFSLAVCAQAQTVTFLSDFNGRNGWTPFGSVVQATDGNFYGTTAFGGLYEEGNVFRMTPDGKIASIYSFCAQANCADGQWPESGTVLGSDGNLYGLTFVGGAGINGDGNGTVYRMTLNGKITTLHIFSTCYTGCADGVNPTGIVLGSDGNLYGTTGGGGTGGGGTIFQVSASGGFKTLYSLCSQANCADGNGLYYPLVEGNDGNFYGTSVGGGSTGGGVFFQITPAGAYTVLHNFCNYNDVNCSDGAYPYGIVKGADGNFYGTATGVVFKITPAGEFTKLYSFNYGGQLGLYYPQLTLASDGNLYGVFGGTWPGTWAGQSLGGLYKVTPGGVFKPLYAFCQCGPTNGYAPMDSLFQATDGNLYGTTGYNGYTGTYRFSGFGTVFKLSTGLSPIVETVPRGAKVGKQVLILGNNLTGATSVLFNGVQADFTVESDTYIKATVPTGATTGKVSVLTPTGTLNSNPQFVVTR